jgi:hypothetical protein
MIKKRPDADALPCPLVGNRLNQLNQNHILQTGELVEDAGTGGMGTENPKIGTFSAEIIA